ncbi:MAG TPA: hypothetical protein VH419_10785 [Nocardioidaceae bacterium]|jgi:hypothetical protein
MKTTWEVERNRGRLRRSRRRVWTPAVPVAAVAMAIAAGGLTPADANDRDVIRRGSCSGHAEWKLKASPEDGRIEVEAEVDSSRNGQVWKWRILHNGDVSAHGTRKTKPPSGSFEVRRLMLNLAGTDTIGWRARQPASGQVCRGSLRF